MLHNEPNNEDELKRYLMLVSYSGMGLDSTLDKLLRQLRQTLKQSPEIDNIKTHVDEITHYLRTLEEKVELTETASPDDGIALLHQLIDQLLELSLPKKHKKHLQSIQDTLPNSHTSDTLESLARLVGELIDGSNNEKKSWNLFGRKSADSEQSAGESSEQLKDETLPEKIIHTLRHFVEQLSTIDLYKKFAESVGEQLVQVAKFDDLTKFIEQMAAGLLDAANQDHQQFESFLKSLNKRLLHVASFLNQASVGQQDVLTDTEQLDLAMRESLQDIQKEIETNSELGPFRERLMSSFKHIFDSINRFKEGQQNRIEASLAELSIVREQLQATEDEAERLKQNIIEQRDRAYTDQLTQLPNRYAYNERLTQEYNRWRRYKNPLAMAIGDIDHFKQINDAHGHSIGDKVLRQVADWLQQGIRESDFVARYGGEEFVILMPETELNAATKAINKLRQKINQQQVNLPGSSDLQISLSFGVTHFDGSDTANQVFQRADRALYRAKQKGRNQVCAERGNGL